MAVQRLYSMFPAGGAGLGLALLRCSLAVALGDTVSSGPLLASPTWWLPALVVVCGALLLGALTPVFSFAAVAIAMTALIADAGSCWPQGLQVLLMACALLLIGPGAYSLDARIYGRHRLFPRGRRR